MAEDSAAVAEGPAPGRGPAPAGWSWLLAGAVAAAYATAFAGAFQFDDLVVIVDEPRVASPGAWWRSMPGIRPLLKLTYALNRWSGAGLPGFHAVNLALHAASALLALRLFVHLSRRAAPPGAGAASGAAGGTAALVGALLWALHPVQTEAVTYVSGRSASLSGALALGSLVAWLAGRERGRRTLTHALSPLLMAASLGARETALVLPAVLVLLEAADRRRPFSWRGALSASAAHWAVLLAAAGLFAAASTYRRMLAESLALRPPLENLLVQLQAIAWLAGQVLRPDRLAADPWLPAPAPGPGALLGALALVPAVGWGLATLRRRPAALALLWFLAWLAPSGWWLPRPEPANDRQLYLALAGPAWLLGRWLAAWAGVAAWRRAAVAGLVAGLGIATGARNLVYRDEVAFWADAAGKAPGNPRAWANLGYAQARACRSTEAEAALRRALALDPGQVRAAVTLRLLREGTLFDPADPRSPRCPPPGVP